MRSNLVAVCVASLLIPTLACSEGAQLKLPAFSHLQKQATNVVDVTIGSLPLGLVSRFMNSDNPEDAQAKHVLAGLKSVAVRSYEFDTDFVYSLADINAIRAQLSGPRWSQIATVHSSKEHEDTEVYLAMDHDRMQGLAIISTEPRQFTILNIVGTIGFDQIAKLQHQLNLPESLVQTTSAP
jgi:Domain of unknown function (DUF4252)